MERKNIDTASRSLRFEYGNNYYKAEYPQSLVVIVQRNTRYRTSENLPSRNNKRYIVPRSYKLYDLFLVIRRDFKISSTVGLFFFINNRALVSISKTLDEIYDEYKSSDGFLHITFAFESMYGVDKQKT